MSLFKGEPQKATSYVTSTTETPKWLQDAIYNQIYQATNVANVPFTPYAGTLVAPAQQEQLDAYAAVRANQGAFQPVLNQAQTGMQALSTGPGGMAAASPYMSQAANMSPLSAAQPLMTQAVGTSGVSAAQPYLSQAGQSSVANIEQYMNPYQQNVMDVIAKQGARNLSENLMPSVSDAFIRAGQFGGSRMGEFGARALRDTQEAILNQQSQAAQQGYAQAVSTAQADQARQAQLASTAGGLTQAQQSALMQAAQQTGALTGQQQQLLASLGSQSGQLTQADLQRQQSTLAQMAALAQQGQQMRATDAAALDAVGMARQQQAQREADAKYQQDLLEKQYPKSQLDWLSTQVRGMAPNVASVQTQSGQTTGQSFAPSPLQQLATGFATTAALSKLTGGN